MFENNEFAKDTVKGSAILELQNRVKSIEEGSGRWVIPEGGKIVVEGADLDPLTFDFPVDLSLYGAVRLRAAGRTSQSGGNIGAFLRLNGARAQYTLLQNYAAIGSVISAVGVVAGPPTDLVANILWPSPGYVSHCKVLIWPLEANAPRQAIVERDFQVVPASPSGAYSATRASHNLSTPSDATPITSIGLECPAGLFETGSILFIECMLK